MHDVAQFCVFAVLGILRQPDTAVGRRLACRFLLALVRSRALHAAGRQLAALVQAVEADAGVDAAAESPAALVAATAAAAAAEGAAANQYVLKYARSVPALVYAMTSTCVLSMLSFGGEELQLRELCAELVAELEGSMALEHAARAMLGQSADGILLAGRLRAVASGRCVQHAARCLGMAVLCDADGGSAYGLPPELLSLPFSEHRAGSSVAAGGEMSGRAVKQLRAMVGILQLGNPAPPGRRGALILLLRVGRLAVASARPRAAGEGGGYGGGDGGGAASGRSGTSPPAAMDMAARPRRVVPQLQEELFLLAAEALQAAWRFLSLPRSVEQAVSRVAVAEAVGWWRLAVAVVDRAVSCSVGPLKLASLGGRLAVDWGLLPGCDVLALPAEPPPALAAAIDGGLLRCLELLMRRGGRDPQGPEASVLRGLVFQVSKCPGLGSYLAPLLAYAEPRQGAALVVTLRKLLQSADMQAIWAENCVANSNNNECLFLMVVAFVTALKDQDLEVQEAVADAAPGDERPSPASQQLLSLLSCAACEWLSELSHSLSQALLSGGMARPCYLSAMLAWLPLLAGRCRRISQLYAAAATGPSDDDACGEASRAACCAVAAVTAGLRCSEEEAAAGRPKQQQGGEAVAAAVRRSALEAEEVQAPAAAATAQPPCRAPAGVPAVPPLPWRPGLLREAAAALRSCGDRGMAAQAEGLAAYLELGGDGAWEALRQAPPQPGSLVSALPPPTESRRLLPCRCANPRCANLEGDSEADVALKACAGCGAVGYCCRPCQTAHWRAGHKGECAGLRGNGGR
ncbi:hypothetical protein GPECTOR_42g742 [Gonium pectorale]|uniref:phytol kinase n=1 Tax=Gonium pectorale TaxID=33097 RepID=A0A150GAE1_GONPE|nr:hypothetical protein GPECTOR_42g742 [Gonium pectorale]|eukprot:KXZ46535.1 hypothetical protein GPECTOR_42g742 [Gonium pectorale]